jgi:PhnO protein
MFRKSNEADCRPIYDMMCDMENKELPYDKFETIYKEQLGDEDRYCLVCEEDGETIAFMNLRFEKQLHHCDWIAEIMEFVVDGRCRNRGVGKDVFREACELSAERGCVQIEVACNQLRTDTHRFYRREGMHDFHFKFSKDLTGKDSGENVLGR